MTCKELLITPQMKGPRHISLYIIPLVSTLSVPLFQFRCILSVTCSFVSRKVLASRSKYTVNMKMILILYFVLGKDSFFLILLTWNFT